MELAPNLAQLLDERTRLAVGALREALRIDVYRYLSTVVESRLAKRPHFLATTPPQAMVAFRGSLVSESDRLMAELGGKLRELQAFYGATPQDEAVELEGLERILGVVTDAARVLLLSWAFPSDGKPDIKGDMAAELDPKYKIGFPLSDAVSWAWHHLRSIDRARQQIAGCNGSVAPKTLEVSLHLPEALPPDFSKRPTID